MDAEEKKLDNEYNKQDIIEDNNGNVLLYVHEVNNDAEKIKIAIDIIDNFKTKLDECCSNNDGYTIDKEILDEINKEYQLFTSQKLSQIKNIKDFSTKMVKQIEDSQFPALDKFLCTKYAFSTSKYVCEFCEFIAKNQQAMSAHKRGCKLKNTVLTGQEVTTESNIIIELPAENKKSKIRK
jgi:gamma-glutamyl phosphate reductase